MIFPARPFSFLSNLLGNYFFLFNEIGSPFLKPILIIVAFVGAFSGAMVL